MSMKIHPPKPPRLGHRVALSSAKRVSEGKDKCMRDTAKTDTESSTKTPKPGGSALARAFWRALAFTSMLFGLLAACGGSLGGVGAAPTPPPGGAGYLSRDVKCE